MPHKIPWRTRSPLHRRSPDSSPTHREHNERSLLLAPVRNKHSAPRSRCHFGESETNLLKLQWVRVAKCHHHVLTPTHFPPPHALRNAPHAALLAAKLVASHQCGLRLWSQSQSDRANSISDNIPQFPEIPPQPASDRYSQDLPIAIILFSYPFASLGEAI